MVLKIHEAQCLYNLRIRKLLPLVDVQALYLTLEKKKKNTPKPKKPKTLTTTKKT